MQILNIVVNMVELVLGVGTMVAEVASKLNVPVVAIASLDDLINHLESDASEASDYLQDIKKYRQRYGAANN